MSTGGGSNTGTGGRSPQITLEVLSPVLNFTEGGTQTIVATIVGHPDTATILIDLTFTGSAVLGRDYTVSAESIIILPGQTSGSITIRSIDDRLIELRESIIVDVELVTGGNELNDFQQATVFIVDNDAPAFMMTSTSTQTTTTSSTTVSNAPVNGSSSVLKSQLATTSNQEDDQDSTPAVVQTEDPEIDERSIDKTFGLLSDDDLWI
ncbi:MAG: hypothetical protein R3C11_07260 [Planctomycetaceae bacterium]